MEKLPVSVCMIVRDEAEVLAVALDSVRLWAAQIVVVDTGSSDASLEVARRAGADVDEIVWRDDFAEARNASMALATQPWILILDADEWIDPADNPRIASIVHGPSDRAFHFPQRNYVDRPDWSGLVAGPIPPVWGLQAVGWVVARQLRLVPNHPGIRYEDPVHETMERGVERVGIEMVDGDVPIHHVGKMRSAAIMARKQDLYRRLGELKLERAPSGQALLELGIQCSEVGDHGEARDLLERAVGQLDAGAVRARAVATLGSAIEVLEGETAAEDYLRAQLEANMRFPHVWERLALILVRGGKCARAAEMLERAIGVFPDDTNLLRIAAEAELRIRQFDRARALFVDLERASGGSELGRGGRALAEAGLGDPTELIRGLVDGPDWHAARLARLAPAHFGPDWILRGPAGSLRGARLDEVAGWIGLAYRFRRRNAAAQVLVPDLRGAPDCGLGAVIHAARRTGAGHRLEAGLHRTVGAPRWASLAERTTHVDFVD